jgi:uracil phosphoribosyltransferase
MVEGLFILLLDYSVLIFLWLWSLSLSSIYPAAGFWQLTKTAMNSLLPTAVPIYHLGLFREKITLQPVEYYNNLPFHRNELSPQSPALLDPSAATTNTAAATLAVLLDPIIATGATAEAAIHLLREWGVQRVIMLSVLASEEGIQRAAGTWEGVEVWVGGIDKTINEKGMIVPGLGDIGDRLFVAIGK